MGVTAERVEAFVSKLLHVPAMEATVSACEAINNYDKRGPENRETSVEGMSDADFDMFVGTVFGKSPLKDSLDREIQMPTKPAIGRPPTDHVLNYYLFTSPQLF